MVSDKPKRKLRGSMTYLQGLEFTSLCRWKEVERGGKGERGERRDREKEKSENDPVSSHPRETVKFYC